ncbi:hypothetical protein E7T06_06675 [Deinococcus sp. Arct2-2]|uniref:hypothetical protein n=1 Tax=Deinococcus sp. Arct2-2 TaxID=2568653 RepID=UPI0010A51549|nr:hypothetical protein [Deinococcus sp. Arct2-2]THF70606.1 hypothetical protein E7T06_06675 [Deinococcus sp. Arct2-2]
MLGSASLTVADVQQARHLIQASAQSLWPKFQPAQMPLVVYDGQITVLWGAQPVGAGWQANSDYPTEDRWVFQGRHPQVWANTSCQLEEGLLAASLLLPSLPTPCRPTDLAALAVHEAFHVYQRGQAGVTWQINELDALTYPATDSALLVHRAMELQALQRALTASAATLPEVAAEVLHWREAQSAHLAPEHIEYIRAAERVEGLAHYVELASKRLNQNFQPLIFPPRRCGCGLIRLAQRMAFYWIDCCPTGKNGSLPKVPHLMNCWVRLLACIIPAGQFHLIFSIGRVLPPKKNCCISNGSCKHSTLGPVRN